MPVALTSMPAQSRRGGSWEQITHREQDQHHTARSHRDSGLLSWSPGPGGRGRRPPSLSRFQHQSPELVVSAATHPDPDPLLLSSVKNAQGSVQDEDEDE